MPPFFSSFSSPTSSTLSNLSLSTLFHCLFCHHSVETPFFQLCRSSAQILFAKGAPPRSTSGFMRLPQLLAFDTSRHQFGGGRALRTTLYQIPMRPSQIWIWPNVSHFAWESAQWLMKDLKEIFSSYNGEHCKILKVAFTQTNFAPASHNSHQSMFLDRS